MSHTASTSDRSVEQIPSSKALLRAAGIGGIAAFLFWLLQPIAVFLIVGEAEGSTYEQYQARPYYGLYEAITFGGIAAGVLTFVVSVYHLVRDAARPVLSTISLALGITAGMVWLFAAAMSAAPFTSVGYYLSEEVPGVADQEAVFLGFDLILTGLLLLYGLAMIGWLAALTSLGRRAGLMGRPLQVLALLSIVAVCAPLVMPFSAPWGLIGPLAFMLVAGIAFLVKARKN